ncbi:MAG: hypothetical protein KME23_09435 [Goleter apudmare HA4340-LM2]|jgi:hypothetical protein|nr:hypothetical protein [Goleter apudmare HA4340-LM2]
MPKADGYTPLKLAFLCIDNNSDRPSFQQQVDKIIRVIYKKMVYSSERCWRENSEESG